MGITNSHFNLTKENRMSRKLSPITLLSSLVIAAVSQQAVAETWTVKATPSLMLGSYSGSQARNKISEAGMTLAADYLEQGGVTVGYSNTRVNMKNATTTNQNNVLASGRMNFWPDSLTGRVTVRLDVHDVTGNANALTAYAPQLSWLSSDSMVYADIGYANSKYKNNGLRINQFTPTVGFGFNGGSDWLQLRSYLISGLTPALAANKSSTTSLDANWTHFLAAGDALMPASVTLGLSSGEKIYAVDMDAQSVANLADLSKGSANLAATWNVNKDTKFFAFVGQSRYTDVALNNNYKLNVLYGNLSVSW
jgi:hypothetical protein